MVCCSVDDQFVLFTVYSTTDWSPLTWLGVNLRRISLLRDVNCWTMSIWCTSTIALVQWRAKGTRAEPQSWSIFWLPIHPFLSSLYSLLWEKNTVVKDIFMSWCSIYQVICYLSTDKCKRTAGTRCQSRPGHCMWFMNPHMFVRAVSLDFSHWTVGQCARCHIVCGKQHLDDILLPVDKQSKDPGAPGSLGPPRIHHLPVEETQYKEVSGIPWRSPRLWQKPVLSDQWRINMTVMIYFQLMSLLWAISEGDCQHYFYWETPSTVSRLSRSRTN